jgi:hypothetical protein
MKDILNQALTCLAIDIGVVPPGTGVLEWYWDSEREEWYADSHNLNYPALPAKTSR